MWWQGKGIDPLTIAAGLWERTHGLDAWAEIPAAKSDKVAASNGSIASSLHREDDVDPILQPEAE
jgi:hypothetical protein